MKKRAHYSMVTLATVVNVSLFFSCNIFDSPGAPEKTEISSIFQGSDGEITEGFLLESVGKEIGIGAAIYLPDNFEAIIFKVVDSGTTVIDSTLRKFKEDYFKDTVWIRHTFYTPG
jgi:hypothetical protein